MDGKTRRVSRFQHALLDQTATAAAVKDPRKPSKVAFAESPSLASAKPHGVTKVKATKLTKGNTRLHKKSPWDIYSFVDEIVQNEETVTKVRKLVSGQIFSFRSFPIDEKFEVIEQQFKLLDHHNVLPAEEFFRDGEKAFIRSPMMDVSFDRIVMCRQYPSSKVLASMIGQTMDGLAYLVSNGIICNTLSCSKLLAGKDGCVKIAFSDAKRQEGIRASTALLVKRLASVMMLLMQKFENEGGDTGVQDHTRWPPQDKAVGFLRDLQSANDFHTIHHHQFIDPRRRDGDGFKDLVEKTLDTTLELQVRLTQDEEFHSA